MVRGNCDYIFLQPIFSKTQREILWDMEAAMMERTEWSEMMDEVICRENLPGNTAGDPKKNVRILVCCDFEDSAIPEEKFYHWSPVHMKKLPKFRLCHKKYWDPKLQQKKSMFGKQDQAPPISLSQMEKRLNGLG